MNPLVPSGIGMLDEALGGGFLRGGLILLAGEPGTGKTVLATVFLVGGAGLNEPGVYVGFAESRETYVQNLSKHLDVDLERLEAEGKLKILDLVSMRDEGASMCVEAIVEGVEELKARRLVVDSYNALAQGFKGPLESRVMLQTVLNKLMKRKECTTLLVEEKPLGEDRIGLGLEEFVVDGVLILRRKMVDGRLLRELEVLKMRGARLSNPLLLFTLHGGFTCLKPYSEKWWPQPAGFKPGRVKPNLLSTGVADLDEIIGGGMAFRSFNLLEVGSTVPMPILRLVRPMIVHALTRGHPVLILPAQGMSAAQIREELSLYVGAEALNKLVRVVDYGPEIKEPYCLRLEGVSVKRDFRRIWKTLEELREASGKPTLSIVGFDTVEYVYGVEEGLRILGKDASVIRNMGDVRVNIIRPSVKIRPQLVEVADMHLAVEEAHGVPLIYGVKPRTVFHDFEVRVQEGLAEIRLTPVI